MKCPYCGQGLLDKDINHLVKSDWRDFVIVLFTIVFCALPVMAMAWNGYWLTFACMSGFIIGGIIAGAFDHILLKRLRRSLDQ